METHGCIDKNQEPADSRGEALNRLFSVFGLAPKVEALGPLDRALTHRSWRWESGAGEDNERLELLGDSVIGLICTEYLLAIHPNENEGVLSKLRASMVSRAVLGEIAVSIDLGELMNLGAGEEKSGGRVRRSTLGSALEAVCGALYLHYPWQELKPAVTETILKPAHRLTEERLQHDYKSILQEWSQRNGEGVPEYRLTDERGPEHDRVFVTEAWLGDRFLGRGEGRRKKFAENDAARAAVIALGLEQPPDSP